MHKSISFNEDEPGSNWKLFQYLLPWLLVYDGNLLKLIGRKKNHLIVNMTENMHQNGRQKCLSD